MAIITGSKTALDVHVPGTIGTFRVSADDGKFSGIEVRYILTHVTLSEKIGQAQLLSMLAPVREVFDLKQLGFEEIMQRDIDDARVSLELIPYLLDTSTAGQIKLFPPIVAVAMPLKPNSKAPEKLYRKVSNTRQPSKEHPGIDEVRTTAGGVGEEQFEFFQLYQGDKVLTEGAELRLSRDNSTLAIVDGQHRAMALLALYRNLTEGWSDAKRSPYEEFYKVWPEKEIRSYDLSELQLPVLICTFPQLDNNETPDNDVIKAARRVFLTLNKTAKRVSDSRNKLLNDQDIVAECLRATLSHIKNLDTKDDTGLRLFNIELDQEGDRTKIAGETAFSGVSHLYHLIDNILMSTAPARTIESKGKIGAPRKKLDYAFERLQLRDELTQEQRDANTKSNYSEEIAKHFRRSWQELYVPIIDRVFGKFQPFAAFSIATISLRKDLQSRRDTVLEKMLFDGQSTSRTFDEFQDGLKRRVDENEPGWSTPEIKETLSRANDVLAGRKKAVLEMKENRAKAILDTLSSSAKKIAIIDGVVEKPIRDAIDRIYENVFNTIAFQTAIVCTYAEAVREVYKGVNNVPEASIDEYLASLNVLFAPVNIDKLSNFLQVFDGQLSVEDGMKYIPGGPTFRNVVLPGELQPAEWPKYRYLMLELWKPTANELREFVDADRKSARSAVARSLYKRRLAAYCEDKRIIESDLTDADKKDVQSKCKALFEEFLLAVTHKKVSLKDDVFEAPQSSVKSAVDVELTDSNEEE